MGVKYKCSPVWFCSPHHALHAFFPILYCVMGHSEVHWCVLFSKIDSNVLQAKQKWQEQIIVLKTYWAVTLSQAQIKDFTCYSALSRHNQPMRWALLYPILQVNKLPKIMSNWGRPEIRSQAIWLQSWTSYSPWYMPLKVTKGDFIWIFFYQHTKLTATHCHRISRRCLLQGTSLGSSSDTGTTVLWTRKGEGVTWMCAALPNTYRAWLSAPGVLVPI